jgi:uncharacterized OsmC-like protein
MSSSNVRAALGRLQKVLERHPAVGLHDDTAARVSWEGALTFRARDPDGAEILTDMPEQVGGAGAHVTPGWLMRAGLAACSATCIAMFAARRDIELTHLDVTVRSRSDVRGLLGLADASSGPVDAGPFEVELSVEIGARGRPAAELEALVAEACVCSPVGRALEALTPVRLRVEVAR